MTITKEAIAFFAVAGVAVLLFAIGLIALMNDAERKCTERCEHPRLVRGACICEAPARQVRP